jgi:hypothetical protein
MPEDNQAIENWNKTQDSESVSQEPTVAQSKEGQGEDPGNYVPSSLDSQEISILWVNQGYAELPRT